MVFPKVVLIPKVAAVIPKVFMASLGFYVYAAADVATNGHGGDPWGAIVAIVFGSAGLSAVALWQKIKMAQVTVDAERRRLELEQDAASRKAEMASLNDRVSGQDKYIRELELKLREISEERQRWKTLYEQTRPSTTITTMAAPSPPRSDQK